MTHRKRRRKGRRPKVVPRAAVDFVRQLKIQYTYSVAKTSVKAHP